MLLLSKIFLITTLTFTQASRPATNHHLFDYEFAGAVTSSMVRYFNADIYTRVLFEREEGIKGTGHDFNFSFIHKNFIFKNIAGKRSLTSYYRQTKNISLQTIDTSYHVIKGLGIGYSISFQHFSNAQLLAYAILDTKYLTYEIRINPNTTITRIKIHYEKETKKKLVPFISFEYINTGESLDWKQKLGVRWNF